MSKRTFVRMAAIGVAATLAVACGGGEQPTVQPTTEQPTTEQPTTEQPTTEQPTTEQPTTESPTTESPTTEPPTTEQPTTEQPTSAPPQEVPRNPAAVIEGRPYRPQIDPADFVDPLDNPYFPLEPGTTNVYHGVSDGEREVVKVTVTDRTREILGVATIVVRDQVFVQGKLFEDTFDWFASDRFGNVWYFGEATREFEDGKVSTAGSWEAGVDGAQPGIVMLGEPRVGDTYRQEFYRGEAEDMGKVVALDGSATVPHGVFEGVLVTEDWTPLEPKVLERKYYAPGVGVVQERVIRGGEGVVRLVEVTEGEPGT